MAGWLSEGSWVLAAGVLFMYNPMRLQSLGCQHSGSPWKAAEFWPYEAIRLSVSLGAWHTQGFTTLSAAVVLDRDVTFCQHGAGPWLPIVTLLPSG